MKRQWLIDLRVYQSKTQQAVACEVGVSQSCYANIETGLRKPSVLLAKKIAEVLGFDWTRFYESPEQSEDSA